MRLERDDNAYVTYAMWTKDFGARGKISLVKDAKTDEPMVKLQPAHNVGSPAPSPQIYRIVF